MRRTRPQVAAAVTVAGGALTLAGSIVQIAIGGNLHSAHNFAGLGAVVGLLAMVVGLYELSNPHAHATLGVVTLAFAMLGLAASIVSLPAFAPTYAKGVGLLVSLVGSLILVPAAILGLGFVPEVVWEFIRSPGTQATRSGPRPDLIFALVLLGALLLWAGGIAGLSRSVTNLGYLAVAIGMASTVLAVLPYADPERYGDQLSTYLILALLAFGGTAPIFGSLYHTQTQAMLTSSPIPGGVGGGFGTYVLHYFPTSVFLMALGSGLGVVGALWGTILRGEIGRFGPGGRAGWRSRLTLPFLTAVVGGFVTYLSAVESMYYWFASGIPYLTANGSVGVLGLVSGTFVLIAATAIYAAPERAGEMAAGLFILSIVSLLVAVPLAVLFPTYTLLSSGVLGVCVGGFVVLAGVFWTWLAPLLAKRPAPATSDSSQA